MTQHTSLPDATTTDDPITLAYAAAELQRWRNHEIDAYENDGYPLKLLPPEFRKSQTDPVWETSWGHQGYFADVKKTEWQQVIDGTLPATAVGPYALARAPAHIGTDMFALGCYYITLEQVMYLLENTP